MAKKLVKKQSGGISKATPDSTKYYKDLYNANVTVGASQRDPKKMDKYIKGALKANEDVNRQAKKGKPGYDANGFPSKKMGGSTKSKKK